jgi:hypothetical protein
VGAVTPRKQPTIEEQLVDAAHQEYLAKMAAHDAKANALPVVEPPAPVTVPVILPEPAEAALARLGVGVRHSGDAVAQATAPVRKPKRITVVEDLDGTTKVTEFVVGTWFGGTLVVEQPVQQGFTGFTETAAARIPILTITEIRIEDIDDEPAV